MDRLTPRMRQIVALRCGPEELSVMETALRLGIAWETVRYYSAQIRERLGVRTMLRVCAVYGAETA